MNTTMKYILVLFVLALSLVIHFASDIEEDEGVLILTDSNYEDALSNHELLLVEFYAPWCGHCKSLAPEWVKAAKILSNNNSPVKLAKVDATENEEVTKANNLQGYPTIKFFRSGQETEYDGGRTSSEIVSWIDKKTGPPAKTLVTLDDYTNMNSYNDVFILGVFQDNESLYAKAFLDIATNDNVYKYALTSSIEIKEYLEKPKILAECGHFEHLLQYPQHNLDTVLAYGLRIFIESLLEIFTISCLVSKSIPIILNNDILTAHILLV